MKAMRFLTLDEILKMHIHQIDTYGGELGVRDRGLVESAIAMPRFMFDGIYLHTDIFEMASAYLYHLVQNHPFIDGNKRAGAVAAYTFLYINGVELIASPDAFADMVCEVAQGRQTKPAIAEFFRNNTRARNILPS